MASYPLSSEQENHPIQESRDDALARISSLWKVDDKKWISQRYEEWQQLSITVYDDFPKDEKKIIESFFIKGDLLGVIDAKTKLILSPYFDDSSLRSLFNSRLLNATDRKTMLTTYLFGCDAYSFFPWYRTHLKLFKDHILCDKYTIITERTSVRRVKEISPEPAYWCKAFLDSAYLAIEELAVWQPFYSCVSCFISTLPYALKESNRKYIKLEMLWEKIDGVIDDQAMSEDLKIFVEELKSRKGEIIQAWELFEQRFSAQKNS